LRAFEALRGHRATQPGSAQLAVAAGVVPFVLGDAVKVALAALLLRRTMPLTRALR
jgi:biotin transporter BioY